MIDYSSSKTIKNWKTDLNLVCEEGSKIGMIGSFYFIGFVISLLFIVRLSDIYGKKPLTYLALGTQLFAYFGILYYTFNLYMLYMYYLIMGIGAILNICVIFNYCMELMPKSVKAYCASLFLTFHNLPRIIMPLVLWVSDKKDTTMVETLGFSLVIVGLVMFIFMPESPLFYFHRG